jgi:anti-sigma factor RsiW
MNCEPYDWKAYALGELAAAERREAEAHAATCEGCRGELAHVRLTVDRLSALREEEVPRRIAFVSDKVFEPRWWETFLRPARFNPTLAAACVIAAAIVLHGYLLRPVADGAEIQAQINQAVTRAVAQVEQRNADLDRKVTTLYVATTGIVNQ